MKTSLILLALSTQVVPATPEVMGTAPVQWTPIFANTNGRTVKSLWLANQQLAVIRAKAGMSATQWTVEDIKLERSKKVYDAIAGAQISNTTFRRISSTEAQDGLIRLRGGSSNIVIEDFVLHSALVNHEAGDAPAGIALAGKLPEDKGNHIIIRRGVIDGMHSDNEGFQNADGIATEAGYTDVRFEDLQISHNSDGGIDNKAQATCANVTSAHNRRNFKLWYGITCDGPVTSIDPDEPGTDTAVHFYLVGRPDGSSVYHFSHVNVISQTPAPIFVNARPDTAITLIVDSCSIRTPGGTPLVVDPEHKITLKLGPGCTVG